MAVHGPSGVGVVAASTYPVSERRAILVLPTGHRGRLHIPMEEVIDSDMPCSRPSDRRGVSYATPFNAQGDDAVESSSTGERGVSQWYRRGSVVLALLLARRHCCRKLASLVRTHTWLHRDPTSRTLPDGHGQPPLLSLSCRCWWKVQAHNVCLCSF